MKTIMAVVVLKAFVCSSIFLTVTSLCKHPSLTTPEIFPNQVIYETMRCQISCYITDIKQNTTENALRGERGKIMPTNHSSIIECWNSQNISLSSFNLTLNTTIRGCENCRVYFVFNYSLIYYSNQYVKCTISKNGYYYLNKLMRSITFSASEFYLLNTVPPMRYLFVVELTLWFSKNPKRIRHNFFHIYNNDTSWEIFFRNAHAVDISTGESYLTGDADERNIAFRQMWLDCNFKLFEKELALASEYPQNISINYELETYVLVVALGIITVWFMFGRVINFFTLSNFKHSYRKTNAYLISCVSHSLSIKYISNVFTVENEIVTDQLIWLSTKIHSETNRTISICENKKNDVYETIHESIYENIDVPKAITV